MAEEQNTEIADTILGAVEGAGIPILDREAKRQWVQDKIEKGYTPDFILQKLKESEYNFSITGKLLDELYESKVQSSTALKEVKELKEKQEKEDTQKKRSSQVTWIMTSFLLSGVGAFTAYMIKKSAGDVGADSLSLMGMGMAGSLMQNIVKIGWIIAISGAFVGIFLLIMFLADYMKQTTLKNKREQQRLEAAKLEAAGKAPTQPQPAPPQQ